jgi:hypothetical protein
MPIGSIGVSLLGSCSVGSIGSAALVAVSAYVPERSIKSRLVAIGPYNSSTAQVLKAKFPVTDNAVSQAVSGQTPMKLFSVWIVGGIGI